MPYIQACTIVFAIPEDLASQIKDTYRCSKPQTNYFKFFELGFVPNAPWTLGWICL
jgi:hypothetical protein